MEDVNSNWDIVRCTTPYDGDINMKYRSYTVSDHWSKSQPYYGGLDEHMKPDKAQDWGLYQRGSNSTCPEEGFEKCTFQCLVAREFNTEDD